MRYECKNKHEKDKIDFEAIRQSNIQMIQKFTAAKKEAEDKGKIVFKPL
ncbi:hypothetical protein BDD26_1268 [Xenorhabdus cabanillasii]|uniref:Uncharacterized protein n=1 Tax=Xenorhabdus cabanillasii TaxID=351673 RepID=A0A3D9UPI1_9GAMM|nr:hypothetical protein [Xenorhabdus cabanillasii]REF26601.1 hypothetical protein BDD26_1268 [Xenorhabdus cabanillasii]